MKIQHVRQIDDTGCGLACVAMITGKTYRQVKDSMIDSGIFKSKCSNWRTSFKDIRNALENHNIKTYTKRKFKKWRNIPAKIAIVSTGYDNTGNWHWILFVRDIDGCFIYDPSLQRKKIRDLRGKTTGYFIEIINV